MMDFFFENSWRISLLLQKISITDVWLGSKYAFEYDL